MSKTAPVSVAATEEVQRWLDEIKDAKKRESDFRKDGERVLKIYGAEKNETTPFNVLFSNTETLLPALYSAVPRPVVNRRSDANVNALRAAVGWTPALMDQVFIAGSTMDP